MISFFLSLSWKCTRPIRLHPSLLSLSYSIKSICFIHTTNLMHPCFPIGSIYNKSVGNLPAARSTTGGLRIARNSRTSNAEAHACICNYHLRYLSSRKGNRKQSDITYPHRHLQLLHPWLFLRKLRSFQLSRIKRHVNAFHYVCTRPLAHIGLLNDMHRKYSEIQAKQQKISRLISRTNETMQRHRASPIIPTNSPKRNNLYHTSINSELMFQFLIYKKYCAVTENKQLIGAIKTQSNLQ